MTRLNKTMPQSVRVSITLALCAFGTSCASWNPPLDAVPPAREPSSLAFGQVTTLEITPVEGRPQGMIMRIKASDLATELTALDVLRTQGSQEVPVQRIALQPKMRARVLSPQGALLLDAGLKQEGAWSYKVRLVQGNQTRGESKPTAIQWRAPVAAPRVHIQPGRSPAHAQIGWTPKPEHGALVFRRTLAPTPTRITRHRTLGAAHAGQWLDRAVHPGAVYAYRLAHARFDEQGVPYYGFPSEDVYITIPSADVPPPTTQPSP